MKHYTKKDIASWERFYRANFINCLSGFKSATLIGSINPDGIPNLAIFSNIVHIGADPALIGFINRPLKAAPHTIGNIESNQWYTMNHIPIPLIKKAHQTSARYAKHESEFEKTGLTIEWKENKKAPFVAESSIRYLMKLVEIIPIKHNNSFLIIGSVEEIYIEDPIVDEDGFIHIEKAGSITSLGIDAYYETNLLSRFAYAKP
ncbi:MAG TPA: flavin reductase [Ferruginibacter sp.]|nr:flavin reductase [Ferruginibacter sp.]